MLCALIMAGGRGTRFWPLSTDEKPKQFLSLFGEETMIQMTVNRVKPLIPIERIFVCTGERYVSLIKEQLPEIPERNIIVEPEGRNTAPCIALSAMVIKRYYENATMVVLPADHLIKNEGEFLNIVKTAEEFINDYTEAIITFGMTPDRPETGYGYIKYADEIVKINSHSVIKVNSFIEKPNYDKAVQYLDEGKYLWNGGMFIWKVENILNLINKYLPNTYLALKDIIVSEEEKIQHIINNNYGKTDSTSIDFGIMEKVDEIFVIPCEFGWDDVGNWSSIERYSEKDGIGNVFKADGATHNSKNNIVFTSKKILLNHVDDLIVVETDEYIMISSKMHEQEIKNAKKILES